MTERPTKEERRVALQKWRAENPEKVAEQRKRAYLSRRNDPVRYARFLEQSKKSKKKNYAKVHAYDLQRDVQKLRARRRIRERIWNGTLKRLPCEVCGDAKTHAHHDDYSKPLEVKWLCPQHHADRHKELGHD